MKQLVLLSILILTPLSGFAQVKLDWKDLDDVEMEEDFDSTYQVAILYPTFGEHIKQFDGKEVSLKGYLIPIDIEEGKYALSQNTYGASYWNSCGANFDPTWYTDVQLNIVTKKRYLGFKLNQPITFIGRLKLNSTEVTDLIYILEDAELLDESIKVD